MSNCVTKADNAYAAGIKDAEEVTQWVREDSGPIYWLTGNSYFPALRAVGSAETYWQGSGVWAPTDEWVAYCEGFTETLEANDILLDAPEYDNSLYCVDLARFEFIEDSDAETLEGEWKTKEG